MQIRDTPIISGTRAFLIITEPRGSVRPNVRDKDVNGLKRDILVDRMVGLPCPVQGFPAPTFRYYHACEREVLLVHGPRSRRWGDSAWLHGPFLPLFPFVSRDRR